MFYSDRQARENWQGEPTRQVSFSCVFSSDEKPLISGTFYDPFGGDEMIIL
jgi:hypothetical protein